MSDPFRKAIVEAIKESWTKPMTLDEYKLEINSQKETIEALLEKYRGIVATGATTSEQASAAVKVQVLDAKLDLIKYVISQANRIELPKTKMREFL